jgi:inner membrane protein
LGYRDWGHEDGIGWALWIGLVLGYGSHLLGDALTRSGVPLLYPNPRRVHLLPKPLRLLTGSWGEDGVLLLLAMVALPLLLSHLPFGE